MEKTTAASDSERKVCFDDNGYPHNDALECLKNYRDWGDDGKDAPAAIKRLLDYAVQLWNNTYGRVRVDGEIGRYAFVTGGWSGNEDVLSALNQNTLSWAAHRLTRSGGLIIYYTSSDAVLDCDDLRLEVN